MAHILIQLKNDILSNMDSLIFEGIYLVSTYCAYNTIK